VEGASRMVPDASGEVRGTTGGTLVAVGTRAVGAVGAGEGGVGRGGVPAGMAFPTGIASPGITPTGMALRTGRSDGKAPPVDGTTGRAFLISGPFVPPAMICADTELLPTPNSKGRRRGSRWRECRSFMERSSRPCHYRRWRRQRSRYWPDGRDPASGRCFHSRPCDRRGERPLGPDRGRRRA